MKWKLPPRAKVYEALGTIADDRIKVTGDSAEVTSSGSRKKYDVNYDGKSKSISANDNASFWQGYYGYPIIAFLMQRGEIDFDPEFTEQLKGIDWKQLNAKFKNDWPKVEAHVRDRVAAAGGELTSFDSYVDRVMKQLANLKLDRGRSGRPPESASG